jgi:hypothetical protein
VGRVLVILFLTFRRYIDVYHIRDGAAPTSPFLPVQRSSGASPTAPAIMVSRLSGNANRARQS